MFKYLILLIGAILLPNHAYAMHISEGILPLGWAGLWYVFAIAFIAVGISKVKAAAVDDLSFKPLVGMVAAVVFIISAMPVPVPIAGTFSHPTGIGIAAILFGPFISVLMAAIALLMHALFLAHGGITTLGANVMSMGVFGGFGAYFAYHISRKLGLGLFVSSFFAGLIADWATYLATATELALGIQGPDGFYPIFIKIFIAFVPTQLPLGILEGVMTAVLITFIMKRRPDILLKTKTIFAKKTDAEEQTL